MQAFKQVALAGLIFFSLVMVVTAQEGIPWTSDLQQARQTAARENKLVLVHFWTPSCGPCKKLDRNVFPNPQVAKAMLKNYVPVKINAERSREVARQFRVNRWPTDVVITPAGKEISRNVSPQDPGRYIKLITYVADSNRLLERRSLEQRRPTNQYAQANTPPNRSSYQTPGTQFGTQNYRNPQQSEYRQSEYRQPATNRYGSQNKVPQAQNQTQFGQRQQQGSSQYTDRSRANTGVNPNIQQNPSRDAYRGGGGYYKNPQQQQAATKPPYANQSQPKGGSFGYPDAQNFKPSTKPYGAASGSRDNGGDFPAENTAQVNPYVQAPRNPLAQNGGSYDGKSFGGNQNIPKNQHYERAPQQQPVISNNPRRHSVKPQIPTGNPPLALDGYSAVSFLEFKKLVRADKRWGAIHRGRTYLFASAEEQKKFLDDPDRYSPVLFGFDPVKYFDKGEKVAGSRLHAISYRHQMYLFADEASLEIFVKSPRNYAEAIHQAMRQNEPGHTRR